MHHEETDAIRIIQEHLTNAEWLAVEEKYFAKSFTPRQLLALVPWALHEIPVETREAIFSEPGGRAHRVLWLATRGRFSRRTRIAFRHLL